MTTHRWCTHVTDKGNQAVFWKRNEIMRNIQQKNQIFLILINLLGMYWTSSPLQCIYPRNNWKKNSLFFILFHLNSRRNCSAAWSHCFCTNWYDLNYTLTEILPNIYLPHCNLSTGYSSWDKSSTVRPVNETLEAVTKVKHCSQHKQTCLILILTSWSIIILGSSLLVSRTFFFHRVELMRMTKYPIRCTL